MTTIEDVLQVLAQVDDPALADLVLVELLFDQPALLRPAQQVLERLRDRGHPRNVEHLAGGWWRVGDGLQRITEAASQIRPASRLWVLLEGCAGAPGPLWIDPGLHVPAPLLLVAAQAAHAAPLALLRPGRVHLTSGVYQLARNPRQLGRTLEPVQFISPTGQPAGVGTVVEVGDPDDLATLTHELAHAHGVVDELEAGRVGGLLARAVAGWR
jgi:hypothetical protein